MLKYVHRFRLAVAFGVASALIVPAGAHAGTTENLLANGDAELHRCTDDWTAQSPVPGWRVLRGAASVLCYSAFNSARELPITPSNAPAGKALFAAPGADTAIEQIVDVGAASVAIDRGAVDFVLSGWLGGWRDRPERATLTAVFLDAAGHATGDPVAIADVDARARANLTGLVERATRGRLPRNTRRIAVTVQFLSGVTSYHNAYADNISLTLSGDVAGLAPVPAVPPVAEIPPLDHVYVVMMENTNYSDIVHTTGRSAAIDGRMPFLASLMQNGVLLTNMWGTYHPSDQNYVAMVAGDTYKFGPVFYPDYNLPVTHLGDLLDAHGKSWRAYVQNMRTPCNLVPDATGQGFYSPDDQPFAQFRNVIGNLPRCVATTRDLSDFATAIATNTLPAFAWIAADGWWDGEGAWFDNFDVGVSLAKQDVFLQSTFKALFESTSWKTSRSLLIVTWDESLGWGWPDNRVATILVGSPGLLRAGTFDETHYDGYSVLRTVESALGLKGLGRFDRFAQPLNAPFAVRDAFEGAAAGDLRPDEAAATRGSVADTFGRVTTPAAVTQGQPLTLIGPEHLATDTVVNLEPLGRVPTAASTPFRFDAQTGAVTIPTDRLAPGFYGAWLRNGTEPPHRAPLPAAILPPAHVSAAAPGVEIVGATGTAEDTARISIREGSDLIVRYCLPFGAATASTWIGIFEAGTPSDQMTKDNANILGFWLKTPGGTQRQPCGEAWAFASELTPNANYQVLLFRDAANGTTTAVGRTAAFIITPALP